MNEELTKQLIEENKQKKAPFLDLGKCGLISLPEELYSLVDHLEVLSLGDGYFNQTNKYIRSKNSGDTNNIYHITSFNWAFFKNLKYLYLNDNPIQDLIPLTALPQLHSLGLYSTQVSDISALAHLPQLQILNLNETPVSDLSSLANLPQLQKLDLENTQVSDLSPLAHLLQLQKLDLRRTPVSDLSPLANLLQLQKLDLRRTPVSDLSPLANLLQLQILFLSGLPQLQEPPLFGTPVSDLSPLADLPQLQELNLENTPVSDLSPLAHLPQLQKLDLSNTPVSDISVLADLPQLQELNLSSTQLSDISVLANLSQLQKLDLYITPVSDLSPLADLPQLQKLNLQNTQVSDLSPLANLPQLQELNLPRTQVSDLSSLADLPQLQKLDLHRTQVSDLSPLANLPQLQRLHLSYTPVSDLSPLADLRQLQELSLSDTPVSDLSPLADLRQLQELSLSDTPVSDLSPLANLPQLKELYLSDTQASDLSPLANLPQLQKLGLSSTRVSDLSPLADLHQLQKLNLHRTPVSDLSPLESLPKLHELDLSGLSLGRISESLLFKSTLKEIIWEDGLLKNVPRDLLSKDIIDNCLYRLRDYFQSCNTFGSDLNLEVKLLLTGNGRVGKSSLANYFVHGRFVEPERSTDGIHIISWENGLTFQAQPLKVHIWDFAGQDIYHATHRLFMRTKAIHLILWDAQTEGEGEHEYEGHTYQNYKLGYWIQYAKILGGGTPIIVAQNKIDQYPAQDLYVNELKSMYSFREVACGISTKKGKGMGSLKGMLQDTVEELPELQIEWPIPYLELKATLENRKLANDKSILYEDYLTLCDQLKVSEISSTASNTLLHLLHHSGIVFYQQGLFLNQIILDQQWAIDAVYAIFSREDKMYYRMLRLKNGIFNTDDLSYKWTPLGYTEAEQKLFLSFMLSCHICFEIYSDKSEAARYIAPQLLQELKPQSTQKHWDEDKEGRYYMKYQLTFYHYAIMQTFLTQVGKQSPSIDEGKNIWRHGIWIEDKETKADALIEGDPDQKTIIIAVQGNQAIRLLDKIRNTFKDQMESEEIATISFSINGQEYITTEKITFALEKGYDQYPAENENPIHPKDFTIFLHPDEKVRFNHLTPYHKPPNIPVMTETTFGNEMRDIFICHASLDKASYVEPLYQYLTSQGISCWYDKAEIKWGDSVTKKVNEGLKISKYVLAVLSVHSLSKNWPKAEWESALNTEFSKGETKVLPLIIGDDAEIEKIISHYPVLTSKLYVKYIEGFPEIVAKLKDRLD